MSKKLLLDYEYRPSSLAENAPVIIMLHGYGSDESDLFSFAPELPEKYAIFSLKAPHPLKPFGNAWYSIHFDNPAGKWSDEEEAREARDMVSKVIDEIVHEFPIDASDITLLGFSQGTILSFAVALSYPEQVRRVVGLSGYVNANIIMEGIEDRDFSHLKVYSSHGTVDQVIPVDWARNTQAFFNKLNIPCHFSEFPVGHGVAPQNFFEFKKWLEEN